MGLFDWIGEAIGGAFSAFAEFIANGFQGILEGLGKAANGIAQDLLGGVVNAAQNTSDPLHKNATQLYNVGTTPITKGFDHTVAELEKHHSYIDPAVAAGEVQALWDKIRLDSGVAVTAAIAAECASLGQVEGTMAAYQAADKISGATAFAGTVAAMKYKAQWLTAYEYYLNVMNPNNRPGPSDLIRFAYREVWDPTRRAELLRESYPSKFSEEMMYQGFKQDYADDYWAAHWTLPDVYTLNDMLHRGVIDEATWDRFVKYNDYDPTIRPWLKKISYNPYTRVDSQRMWTLDLISEAELIQNYKELGYDDAHAQRMTLWTKISTLATELRARYQKGWLGVGEVRQALLDEGMPSATVETWVQKIVKADAAERTATEKALTKAEIIKGYKQGVLDYPTAQQMLMDLGYGTDEAEYILVINTEALTGSPHSFSEFQTIVNLHKKAQGQLVTPIPPEIPEIEQKITKYEQMKDQAVKDGKTKQELIELDNIINPLKRNLNKLIKEYQGR